MPGQKYALATARGAAAYTEGKKLSDNPHRTTSGDESNSWWAYGYLGARSGKDPLEDQRLVLELHSLARYPPRFVDDGAAWTLAYLGLVAPEADAKFSTTSIGLVELARTAGACNVPHCPCKGSEPHANDVQSIVTTTIKDALSNR